MSQRCGNMLVAGSGVTFPPGSASVRDEGRGLDRFVRRWAAAVAELRLGRAVDPGEALDV